MASVKYSNRGQSGCTTVDYLPDTNTLFPWAVRAADKFKDETWADLVFSIMLGTNDSAIEAANGCPVAPEWYYENMKTIINRLLALYPNCRIVVHRPLWYSRIRIMGLNIWKKAYEGSKIIIRKYND